MKLTAEAPEGTETLPVGLDMPSRRRLRVCSVAYTFYDSDSRVMRYNEALVESGAVVDAIGLREPGRPRVSKVAGVSVLGIQTRTVNEQSRISYFVRIALFFLRATLVLSWLHLRHRYHIIHIHSVPDFLAFVAWFPKLTGAKLILDIHDLLPEFYCSKFGADESSLTFKALTLLERVSIGFVDHVITANDLWQAKLTGRSVAPAKATALVNLPDTKVFQHGSRSRYDDKFLVVYPGSLNWHQGVDLAIEAFGMIREEAPEAEFHIYGSGPMLPELICLTKKMNLEARVKFKSPLPLRDIVHAIGNADLGVVPKRRNSFGDEAFSTKTMEFMAMGVPVVVADTKIDSHYFNDTIVKFFRAGSAEDLARCMLELIKNPEAREMQAAAALRFVQANSWDTKKRVYLGLVDSLLTGKPQVLDKRRPSTSL